MSTKNSSRFTPVIIAVSVVVGILIGTFYAKHFAGNRLGIINGSSNKLNALLRIVAVSYTHLRAHETDSYLVCRLLLEKKKTTTNTKISHELIKKLQKRIRNTDKNCEKTITRTTINGP